MLAIKILGEQHRFFVIQIAYKLAAFINFHSQAKMVNHYENHINF